MKKVFIAIGTNIGNRQENIDTAINQLNNNNVNIIKKSRIYSTAPMYETEQDRFLNMVVFAETNIKPTELLKLLKDLEEKIGRTPSFRNGPRLIDLDILYYDDLIINEEDLQIPHIKISERQFVLQPLMDINPDWLDIRTNKTIKKMQQEAPLDKTLSPIT